MPSVVGLKTHIWANNTRSLLLLAGFPFLLVLLSYAVVLLGVGYGFAPVPPAADGGPPDPFFAALTYMPGVVPVALAISAIWYGIAWLGHQAMIDMATGARVIERRDEPALYNLVENLCIARGVKTPTIRVIDSDALNAFASGLSEGHYSITFTRGLLQSLDREEVEAVAAHELTHILNKDVRLLVIAVIFVGIISFVGEAIFRSMRFAAFGGRSNNRRNGGRGAVLLVLVALAIAAIAYGLAIVIRFALSRKREYLADAGAVELTKNPDGMIRALERISGRADLKIPEELQVMCIENHSVGFAGLFATHPPIEKRIAALSQYAGGRSGLSSGAPFWQSSAALEPQAAPAMAGPWDDAPAGPWE